MADASDFAVGAVLGQRIDKVFHPIYYVSKLLNSAQKNYTTTEKELLAVVYALEKFRQYILGYRVVCNTDHAAIRYLLTKKDTKPRMVRWLLLMQEFDLEIVDRRGSSNQIADHLSRLQDTTLDNAEINDYFPDEMIFQIETCSSVASSVRPWYADYANFVACDILPEGLSYQQKKRFLSEASQYFWEAPNLFKSCGDQMIRRCVAEQEQEAILEKCHGSEYGGHHGGRRTAFKVLQSGFYWPTLFKDAQGFCRRCLRCQKFGNITWKNEMPQQGILEVELFDVWGIDFMGPLPSSFGHTYILLAVEYVSKWIEAVGTIKDDSQTVIKFLKKNIFTRFGVPKALVSDGGTHFCNKAMKNFLVKMGIHHKVATPYHPQSNGMAEVSNREIKKILERTVSLTRKDWFQKLDDALWAYRTAYKNPIGMTPFRMLYGKACHLPLEVEHKAYWAIRALNMDANAAMERRMLDLNELEELRLNSYRNAEIYKHRTKCWHDNRVIQKEFHEGQPVLVFNSRLKIFPGKFKDKWSGPYIVKAVYPNGVLELSHPKSDDAFKVNGQRVKPFISTTIPTDRTEEGCQSIRLQLSRLLKA